MHYITWVCYLMEGYLQADARKAPERDCNLNVIQVYRGNFSILLIKAAPAWHTLKFSALCFALSATFLGQ